MEKKVIIAASAQSEDIPHIMKILRACFLSKILLWFYVYFILYCSFYPNCPSPGLGSWKQPVVTVQLAFDFDLIIATVYGDAVLTVQREDAFKP